MSIPIRWCTWALIAASLAVPTPALADDDDPAAEIARGIELYEDLEYEQAVSTLRAALADTSIPDPDRVRGFSYLGLALLALGNDAEAGDTFRKLLELDPKFRFAETENPRARKLLESVRLDLPAAVSLSQTASPVPGRADSPIAIAIEVKDPSGVVRGVTVLHRLAGTKRFSTLQATALGAGRYSGAIPGAFVSEPGVEYFVAARATDGRQLATAGSAAEPIDIAVEAAPSRSSSVLASPWLWAGVGTVAVAGAVAAVLLLRSDDAVETGQVRIRFEFP